LQIFTTYNQQMYRIFST